jgi:hypothetical protein
MEITLNKKSAFPSDGRFSANNPPTNDAVLDDYVRVALCEWVYQNGLKFDCPRKLEDIIGEEFPGNRVEIDALVSAFRLGVPGDLMWNPSGESEQVLFNRLVNRLFNCTDLSLETSRWTVESWVLALSYAENLLETTKINDN